MKKLVLLSLALLLAVSSSFSMPLHPETLKRMDETQKQRLIKRGIEMYELGVDNPNLAPDAIDRDYFVNRMTQKFTPEGISMAPSAVDTFRVLLLMIDFSDHVADLDATYFDSLMFDSADGSVTNFYRESSYGTIEFGSPDIPSSLGWIRNPQTYVYYVAGDNGYGTYPANVHGMVRDAVIYADTALGVDFSLYDNDNNGIVDGLMIVHSGPGAEFTGSGDDIWSHSWSLSSSGASEVLDGVLVNPYVIMPELLSADRGVNHGVFVHELGHMVFHLPDLYDRDYSSEGLGNWSLMAGGSWNGSLGDSPAHPDAWSRIRMGFVSPTNIIADTLGYELPAVINGPNIVRLWSDGIIGDEYFLVENRQRLSYDSKLPWYGLLIYHIDESVSSQNDDEWTPDRPNAGNYLVALEQADGRHDLENSVNDGDDRDPYPGYMYKRKFNGRWVPQSFAYDGSKSFVVIESISNSADTMSFNIRVETPAVPAGVITVFDTLAGIVTVSWDPYEPAYEGELESYNAYINGELTSTTADTFVVEDVNLALGDINLPEPGDTIPIDYGVSALLSHYETNISGIATVQIEAPAVPTGLIAVLDTLAGTVALSWDTYEPAYSGVPNSYKVYRNGELISSTEDIFAVDDLNPLTVGELTTCDYTVAARLTYYETLPSDTSSVEWIPASSVESDFASGLPRDFAITGAFPNPFNPTTTVQVALPGTSRMMVKVYSVLGREVATLADGVVRAGVHNMVFDARGMASGIYFVRATAQEFGTKTFKLLLVR